MSCKTYNKESDSDQRRRKQNDQMNIAVQASLPISEIEGERAERLRKNQSDDVIYKKEKDPPQYDNQARLKTSVYF